MVELEITNEYDKDYKEYLASNTNYKITLHLPNFKFRKNVNFNKLVKEITEIYLVELLCFIQRDYKNISLCEREEDRTAIDNIYIACPFRNVAKIILRR